MTELLDELRFVRWLQRTLPSVGVEQQLPSKDLRRLGGPQVRTRNRLLDARVRVDSLQRAGDGSGQQRGSVLFGRAEHPIDPGLHDQRPGGIVDGDEIHVGPHSRESVLHRIGPLRSAGHNLDVHEREIRQELLLEPVEILGGDNDQRLNDIVAIAKGFRGSHPDGTSLQLDEDFFLRLLRGEPAALSGGGQNDGERGHGERS